MTEDEIRIQLALNTLAFQDISEDMIKSIESSILITELANLWLNLLINLSIIPYYTDLFKLLKAFLDHPQLGKDNKDIFDRAVDAYFNPT